MTLRGQTAEASQLERFSPGPKERAQTMDLPALDARSEAQAEAVELEDTPSVSEEALAPSALPSEDPVRLYLKEIGKVPLLKAEEEVTIGQRIEAGQIALRRTLGGIPLATARLGVLVDRVRKEEIPLDDVILLPEGGEPKPDEVKPMLGAVARVRRLQGEIERLETALHDKKRRSAATRA